MPALSEISGRAASIERRRALSAGKTALPPAAERVRNGERTAALPTAASSTPTVPTPGSPPRGSLSLVGAASPAAAPAATNPSPLAVRASGGRAASIERRLALSAGKSALPPSTERVRNGERSAALPSSVSWGSPPSVGGAVPAAPSEAAKNLATPSGAPHSADKPCAADCCNNAARARRAMRSLRGRGDAPAAPPSRPTREGRLEYAPKVITSLTQGRQTVTGSRIGHGSQVTGVESGANLPVSGTQYIGREAGLAAVPVGPKVGLSRTPNGGVVTGTQIRSKIAVTGDEAGSKIAITGESEQHPDDDLTERKDSAAQASAQFQRQAEPHGHTVFGTNLGRSLRQAGSRARERSAALETTERGLAITGSAVGRASRMTGDEDGACRHVTGDQYLSPARAQAECGGVGGGTASPAAMGMGMVRRDPVTGGKVSVATTWGSQRLTGTDVEHDPRVTGDMQGSCSVLTGTHYHGPRTLHGWCDPAIGESAEQQLQRRPATSAVTGDTPLHDDSVTGTGRGAARSITGTPYYRKVAATEAPKDVVAAVDEKFSVTSPQRAAQLRADRTAVDAPTAAGRITGAFAIEPKKLTGNLEFTFRPRHAPEPDAKPGRSRISGEGRTAGTTISGASWGDQSNVTGTDGSTAHERNPSERNGKPHAFAGAAQFKSKAVKEEHKQLVTGMFGWSSSSAAKVTLSGGAHG
jgi:hypothetical protein